MPYLLSALAAALFLFFLWLCAASVREHETTAARRSLLLALLVPIPYLAAAWFQFPGQWIVGWSLAGLTLGLPAVLAIPTGKPGGFVDAEPVRQVDERTIMFSRAALEPGSKNFEEYYQLYSEHRAPDDRFRQMPGLMSPQAGKYEPLAFAAAGASFEAVEELAGLVEGEPTEPRQDIDAESATRFFKGWAHKLGAVDCGVTELKKAHLYSVKGRGPRWGEDIDLSHRFAIAFTVEMDHRNLGQAPEAPTLMESSQQYLNSGAIAVQLAACIRRLGWPAEAHIDANYKVICPLVARDAGLGEIGRMGLLMTPTLGPRVRIAVVTTDLPLQFDARRPDPTVLHFCSICRKCAAVCPPGAVPHGDLQEIDGVPRWRIDDAACFSYWCSVGTDCGRCMRVCPYSHPDTPLHNLVRFGLGNSKLFRHFALWMDDLLYGRRPSRLPRPDWLPKRKRKA